jgi:hypothetical protein
MAKRTVTLSPAEERSRRALGIAMRLLDRDDADLASVLSLSRQAAQQRRTGGARLRQQDVEDIATAWDLPVDLFRMEAEEAVGWLLDNRRLIIAGVGSEHPRSRSRWSVSHQTVAA